MSILENYRISVNYLMFSNKSRKEGNLDADICICMYIRKTSSFCVCYIRLANTAGNIIIDDIAMFLLG